MAFLSTSQSAGVVAPIPPLAAAERAPLVTLAQTGALPDSDLVLRFFPVYDFQRQGVAALFCTPMCDRVGAEAIYGHRAFRDFSVEEWTAIDCAMLSHAVDFADLLARNGIVVAVGASVSFATLSDPRGGVAYREALRGSHAREQTYLVVKLEDIPAATAGKRIGEIASCLKGLAPRVWVHLPGSHVPLGGHDALSAAGLVLSMPAKLPLHGMQTEARWLAKQATQHAALACMDHVDTAAELDTTRAAGVRFVAGHALHRPALASAAPLDEIRASLYGEVAGSR